MDRKADEDDDEQLFDDVPLHHKRPFGSGLSRKPIAFVPAKDGHLVTTDSSKGVKPAQNISDLYLSLVLPEEARAVTSTVSRQSPRVCEVCQLPVAVAETVKNGGVRSDASSAPQNHESSLAHQVCLAHSHPPSALDRSRMGLNYLESYGWDPDARAGLGVAQQGIHFPLKPKPKEDTLGIGVVVPKNLPRKREKAQKLDAGKVRKMAQEDKKRAERIGRHFYSNSEVEKYFGSSHAG